MTSLPITGLISGIATAALLLCFLGIVMWAYSGRRRDEFARAARMPLDADVIEVHNEVRS